jgi:hypothetical protein
MRKPYSHPEFDPIENVLEDFRDILSGRSFGIGGRSRVDILNAAAVALCHVDNRAAVPRCAIHYTHLGYVLVVLNPFDHRSINPFALDWTGPSYGSTIYRHIA